MIEMKVFGLALDEDSQVPVLILKDEEEKIVLPIWIGAVEAMSISLALNDVRLPRPMTHDLLLSSIAELGGKVLGPMITRSAGDVQVTSVISMADIEVLVKEL